MCLRAQYCQLYYDEYVLCVFLINNVMILSKTVLVRKACEMYMNNSETMYCTWAF